MTSVSEQGILGEPEVPAVPKVTPDALTAQTVRWAPCHVIGKIRLRKFGTDNVDDTEETDTAPFVNKVLQCSCADLGEAEQECVHNPSPLFANMLDDLVQNFFGRSILEEPPLQLNNTDQGWTAPWSNTDAVRGLEGKHKLFMGATTLFSFDMDPNKRRTGRLPRFFSRPLRY